MLILSFLQPFNIGSCFKVCIRETFSAIVFLYAELKYTFSLALAFKLLISVAYVFVQITFFLLGKISKVLI